MVGPIKHVKQKQQVSESSVGSGLHTLNYSIYLSCVGLSAPPSCLHLEKGA